jgi:hypothetical protein
MSLCPALPGWIVPSTEKTGIFEQRRNTVEYFKTLMTEQGYHLKSIQLKQKYRCFCLLGSRCLLLSCLSTFRVSIFHTNITAISTTRYSL